MVSGNQPENVLFEDIHPVIDIYGVGCPDVFAVSGYQVALDFCIVNESLLANKEILTQVFLLLNHENHYIRNQAEKVLSFCIEYSSESKEDIIELLTDVFSKKDIIQVEKRQLLDKWILSKFHKTASEVKKSMKNFDIHKAVRAVDSFVIEDFSNWYLRRSRKRLWVEEKTDDKLAGYSTMYDICIGLSKLLAPYIPFITEEMYQNLRTDDMPESVHLCDYIRPDEKQIDKKLEEGMEQIRALKEKGKKVQDTSYFIGGCQMCYECARVLSCPAIRRVETYGIEEMQIDQDRCIRCGVCYEICPNGAIRKSTVDLFAEEVPFRDL